MRTIDECCVQLIEGELGLSIGRMAGVDKVSVSFDACRMCSPFLGHGILVLNCIRQFFAPHRVP